MVGGHRLPLGGINGYVGHEFVFADPDHRLCPCIDSGELEWLQQPLNFDDGDLVDQ